jgi:YidC/Oxa1 family membrane protein insertase
VADFSDKKIEQLLKDPGYKTLQLSNISNKFLCKLFNFKINSKLYIMHTYNGFFRHMKKNVLIISTLLLILATTLLGKYEFKLEVDNIKYSPATFIKDKLTFFGLASYYNGINYYIVKKDKIEKIGINDQVILKKNEYLAIVKRLNVMLIKEVGLSVKLDKGELSIDTQYSLMAKNSIIKITPKSELLTISPELDQIRYYHLWTPLAWLSKLIESILVLIQTYIVSSWGVAIIVFAILLKLLLLPVGIMTTNFQRKVSQVQSSLAPKLSDIKTNYDGEEAHNRLMAAHKELGVSPFYALKPMLGLFIQIPILIAVFNALGEMSQFAGQSFLWIENLAYPDAIRQLSFVIPMFGDTINLLPFIMMTVAIYSTIFFQNSHISEAGVRRQKRNLYFMAAALFILFYPFPAVMVLYWVLANILQTIQQQFIKI